MKSCSIIHQEHIIHCGLLLVSQSWLPSAAQPILPSATKLENWLQVQAERLCRRRHVADLPGLIATPGVLPCAQFCQCKQQRTQESSYMDCQIGHFTRMSGWCLSPPEPKMSIEWSCCTGAQVILFFKTKLGPSVEDVPSSKELDCAWRRQTFDVRQ